MASPAPRATFAFRRPPLFGASLESYRRERVRELSFPAAVALVEGGFVGVLADKLYAAPPLAVALIATAPMAGNLSSLLWARLAEGRAKIPYLTALQTLFALVIAGMAFLPPAGSAGGVWALVALMGVSRLLLGGIVTLRSLVWTHNYERVARARVTAWLSILTIASMSATSLVAGLALDFDPRAFRVIYAVGALIAVVGIVVFSKIKLRDLTPEAPVPGDVANRESAARASTPIPEARGGSLALLRGDPHYARYLFWQFVLGFSAMMAEAPIIWLVSRELAAEPAIGVTILQFLPLALSALSLPVWGPYLARVHVARFRARHGWLWVVAQLLVWLGALGQSLFVVALGRAVFGFARGGGLVAWQIGHNDFTTPERAHLYMGVHVTLTGMRGIMAPILGMMLYLGSEFAGWLPPWSRGLGPHLFLCSALFAALATLGFGRLDRKLTKLRAAP